MRFPRTAAATGLLAGAVGLAGLGVLVHYGLTAEYGDVTDSALQGLGSGFSVGIDTLALVLVALAAGAAALVATRTWLRRAALATPVLMVVGMLAVTPAALAQKLDVQYDTTPQCVSAEIPGPSPAARGERASQRALESIDHVGYFGGGGGAGVGGCDRSFVLLEDVDVLQHYRSALREAGWRGVEDRPPRLRAERGGMAFEVLRCGRGGVVWAGRVGRGGTIGCEPQ
jgi:hypothetical protein